MSTLWIDARAGLAGDMLCAALLDAGGSLQELQNALSTLGLPELELSTQRVTRGAFDALHFRIQVAGQPADAQPHWPTDDAGHDHSHSHAHDHSHSHSHDHDHSHDHGHDHSHAPGADGSWQAIRAMLQAAPLPERARARALQVFEALAQVEARAHGVPVEQVHFHEVGAADSIADIVGACLLLEQLDVDRIVCTELPLGGGPIRTAHGRITAPAPATTLLLRGWPCFQDGRNGELVTPTGAAIVATLAEPGPMPSMVPTAQGFGAGTWDPSGWGNLTRVLLGTPSTSADPTPGEVIELQTQVDDMTGEWIPALLDALFDAGAVDAFTQPVQMKKGRPALLVTALCPPAAARAVGRALLTHSTSFGLRQRRLQRQTLRREHRSVQTPYGPVRIKLGWLEGELLQHSPEHQDCARAAREHGVPLPKVYACALAAFFAQEPDLGPPAGLRP